MYVHVHVQCLSCNKQGFGLEYDIKPCALSRVYNILDIMSCYNRNTSILMHIGCMHLAMQHVVLCHIVNMLTSTHKLIMQSSLLVWTL